tara:strand:+ start:296 stop:499 length:204 start_codon:yes stop_codon:yes gene_type:complete
MANIPKKTKSPCVKICKYDESFMNGMVCIGCFREQNEITNWLRMTDEERELAYIDINNRKKEFKNER